MALAFQWDTASPITRRDDDYNYSSAIDRYGEESKYYASQAIVGAPMSSEAGFRSKQTNGTHDSGPGFFQKVANTPAFEKVKDEAGNIGNAVVQELSNTAKSVVLPALITSLRNFIGDYLPNAGTQDSQRSATQRDQSRTGTANYQPSLERNQ